MNDGLRLRSVHNVRDVAGTGYPLAGGGAMSRGVVYRGTVLTVDDADLSVLERAGITRVVDLRTAHEVAQQPDVLPAGAEYVHVDVLAGHPSAAEFGSTVPISGEAARADMVETYESFVRGAAEREAFGAAVRAIATAPGPVIVHCTAGKDRTGWVSALLQLLVGVSDDDVLADYLLTNALSTDFVAAVRGMVVDSLPEMVDAVDVLLAVDEAYLHAALGALREEFGDVRTYLLDGAGLELSVLDRLLGRLTR